MLQVGVFVPTPHSAPVAIRRGSGCNCLRLFALPAPGHRNQRQRESSRGGLPPTLTHSSADGEPPPAGQAGASRHRTAIPPTARARRLAVSSGHPVVVTPKSILGWILGWFPSEGPYSRLIGCRFEPYSGSFATLATSGSQRQKVAKPSASRRFWRTVWSSLPSLACMANASVGSKLGPASPKETA